MKDERTRIPGDTGTPAVIFENLNAFQRTAALKAAIELDVFSAIGADGGDLSSIAVRCDASERGLRILCDSLTVYGLLEKTGERYALTPDTEKFLDRSSPAYMGDAVQFLLHPRMIEAYDRTADAVRRGGTALEGEGTVSTEDPIWEPFATGMAALMRGPAELLAERVSAISGTPKNVLDVAASHGEFGFAFLRRDPGTTVHALDWPHVLKVTERRAGAQGLGGRLRLVPGDVFEVDLPEDLDLVLLPNILHHFDFDRCTALLKRVRGVTRPGGSVAVLEFVPNEDRVSPPGSALFALTMLCTTAAGDAYTFREYSLMLELAGFRDVQMFELMPGMQRAVVASV